MNSQFTKMNGAGNDFVLIDNRDGKIPLEEAAIAHVCDRRRGVGADGFISIELAQGYDFYMHFFNADGTPAEMCGNGSRCSAHFAASLGLGTQVEGGTDLRFTTDSGDIEARVRGERVAMSMMDGKALQMEVAVRVAKVPGIVHFMTVGTRHVIVVVDDATVLTASEITELGRTIRHHPAFGPIGANVNFASKAPDGRIHLRTYEKGVEAETHACGTGSVASAVVFAHLGRGSSPEIVVQRGGEELEVSFELRDDGAANVELAGPVAVNFVGKIEV